MVCRTDTLLEREQTHRVTLPENWHSSLLHHWTLGTRHPLPPHGTLVLHHIIYNYLILYTYIQGVSIPMSQTSPGYSPPQNKQKSSYQHGSKNEKFPRYPVLCRNPRIAIKTTELPFHIRYDSHVTAVASCTQVFIVHAWVVPRRLFLNL